jgi:hypothetical protein
MARCNIGVPLIKFLLSVTSAQTPHSNPLAVSASEPVAALSIGNHQRCDPIQVQWVAGFFLRRPPSPYSLPASAKVILASLFPGARTQIHDDVLNPAPVPDCAAPSVAIYRLKFPSR